LRLFKFLIEVLFIIKRYHWKQTTYRLLRVRNLKQQAKIFFNTSALIDRFCSVGMKHVLK
jgi:hypothetical protein